MAEIISVFIILLGLNESKPGEIFSTFTILL